MLYYYDHTPQDDPAGTTAVLPAAEPEPTAPPEAPAAPPRRKKDRSERGAATLLAVLSLLLGGTAVLLALRAQPVALEALLPGTVQGQPGVGHPSVELMPAPELRRAPNGDGTVLTLAERPAEAAMSFQDIYKKVSPSVVFIRAATGQGISQGTGVVMSADGYIITNAHVIEGSFRADVVLEDGGQYEALLVGSDAATDLAVLKIDAQGLTPAEFGDSDQMEVGDVVVAIGNPMGEELRGTMTDGILSAINRDMEVEGRQMTLLQTTAALNTGNSGGALINDMGQVIGITNMKLMAYNSTVEGLGFAIPSRTAKTVVDDLIGYGVVKGRPMLGITVRPLTAEERTGRSLDHGLWVEQVEEKSDAWTQGIRTGDVLLSANGVELSVNDDLLELKNALAVGETIQFCLWREGETLDITVELVEQYSLE
ncbi:MAG: trypsin-like peptidase domain-containing protein [Oscillospiraceae bacterium]|uniref:S1C family serine protease n=1 Tax=Intestinimonas massiliensis (ex Afouda et al. 2020) TaxID=1673721 RepID=A0ABS9MBX6_9FIRM|nr:trypsin-like peptidase domain-containing protein [Intestinimonas massiliensis (ex Afouda et al. 2020)]MBS6282079.1 trypsin-like peptidase domain-containing protein [Oscillospiraceae bacterium]MCG4528296.1 S1C family serine protease [Intestinimonas massiliensis (ex Afouda et al. 2020)]MCQ4806894.1 S1C family serine protease [Intestinimonas massiliensis (ex Afouda et al. 2020)]